MYSNNDLNLRRSEKLAHCSTIWTEVLRMYRIWLFGTGIMWANLGHGTPGSICPYLRQQYVTAVNKSTIACNIHKASVTELAWHRERQWRFVVYFVFLFLVGAKIRSCGCGPTGWRFYYNLCWLQSRNPKESMLLKLLQQAILYKSIIKGQSSYGDIGKRRCKPWTSWRLSDSKIGICLPE